MTTVTDTTHGPSMGEAGGWSSARSDTPDRDRPAGTLDLPEWERIWAGCQRRIRQWRIPPHWSTAEWLEEMRAEGVAAALQAMNDFNPELGVPLSAYLYMRVMGNTIARYRKEWSYATLLAGDTPEAGTDRLSTAEGDAALRRDVESAVSRLPAKDRELILRLYWGDETETQVAKTLGVSQQAVNKRKRGILHILQARLGRSYL